MPIADFQPQRRQIVFPGGSFDVRAVCLQDVARLVYDHQSDIDHIVGLIRARTELNFEDFDVMSGALLEVIRQSPMLAADLICLCADEPTQIENALRLPVTIQLEAITAIGELTFTDAATAKKFVADVRHLILRVLPPRTEALAAE